MKNHAVIILPTLLLIGCTNTYTYREDQKPIDTFTSLKAPQKVQECILMEWQKQTLGNTVQPQQAGDYFSVLAITDNLDAFKEGETTKVNYYSVRGSLDPWNGIDKRIKSIKSCI